MSYMEKWTVIFLFLYYCWITEVYLLIKLNIFQIFNIWPLVTPWLSVPISLPLHDHYLIHYDHGHCMWTTAVPITALTFPPASMFISAFGFVGSAMDGRLRTVLNGQAHKGHIRGQLVMDDFGADNASANMQHSFHDPGVDRDCLSQTQVILYFSFAELSISQP